MPLTSPYLVVNIATNAVPYNANLYLDPSLSKNLTKRKKEIKEMSKKNSLMIVLF